MKRIIIFFAVVICIFVLSCVNDLKTEVGVPTLTLVPSDNIHFSEQPTDSEFVTVEVVTTCKNWSVDVDQSWCKVKKNNTNFVVSANPNTKLSSPPIATILVTANMLKQQIYVTQDAATSFLTISPQAKIVPATGGVVYASVSSNTSWRVISNQSWATPIVGSGRGNQQIQIRVDANSAAVQDKAEISILTDSGNTAKLVITRLAATSTLTILPQTETMPATGGIVCASVSSNTSWRVISNQSWATPIVGSGRGNQQIQIRVDANSAAVQDKAEISISTDSGNTAKLVITRLAATSTLTISPRTETISATGGKISAIILSNANWKVFSNQSWAIPDIDSGSGNLTLIVTVLPNKSKFADTATITVYSEENHITLTITRQPGPVYSVGDYYPEPNSPSNALGIVFCLDNPVSINGTQVSQHGKILDVNAVKGNFWFDKIYGFPWVLTNANSRTNGLYNVEAVKKVNSGNLTGYAAFAYCKRKTDGGLYWYLPAIDELRMAYMNRGLISPKIKILGGVDLNVDQISSTEHSERTMYYMRSIGDSWPSEKTVTKFYTRPVTRF